MESPTTNGMGLAIDTVGAKDVSVGTTEDR